jgi:hypothetical protein
MKAIVLLAKCKHSRDADEIGLLVADRLPDEEFVEAMNLALEQTGDEELEIPDWVFDVHTARGKRAGKTREDFMRQEHAVMDKTMFLNFDEMVNAWGYVEPNIDWGGPRRSPRGTCPLCGADVALRKGGLVREHRDFRSSSRSVCAGSGQPAK